jgi:hypothetical protein
MAELPGDSSGLIPGPEKGVFRWDRLLAWVPLSAVLGLLIAWAAVVAEGYFAPLLLFPLVVGVVLGGTIVLAMRVCQVGHRPTIWLGALLAASVAIAGEHYFSFQKDQRQWARDPKKLAQIQLVAPERIPPPRFGEYLKWSAARGWRFGPYTVRGGLVWLAWSIDALLVLGPAILLVGATARLPYCNRCVRWFRTVRGGRLDSATAVILAGLVGTELGREPQRARYRVLACQGVCGPTGFVLSWDDPGGRLSSGIVWLDAGQRDRVVEILDQSGPPETEKDAPKADGQAPRAENEPPKTGP